MTCLSANVNSAFSAIIENSTGNDRVKIYGIHMFNELCKIKLVISALIRNIRDIKRLQITLC